jgi:hypothetical protein
MSLDTFFYKKKIYMSHTHTHIIIESYQYFFIFIHTFSQNYNLLISIHGIQTKITCSSILCKIIKKFEKNVVQIKFNIFSYFINEMIMIYQISCKNIIYQINYVKIII